MLDKLELLQGLKAQVSLTLSSGWARSVLAPLRKVVYAMSLARPRRSFDEALGPVVINPEEQS